MSHPSHCYHIKDTKLVLQTLTLIYVIVTAAIHISLIHSSFREDLRRSIGSAVVFVLGFLFLIPVSALFSYHIRVSLIVSSQP